MSAEPMTVEAILKELRDFNPRFPREALREAVIQKETLIPYLLESLDYAADQGRELMQTNSPYGLHIYALFLLAQFRETQGFPKLIRLISLEDPDLVDFLLGDTLADDYPAMLHSTFDGSLGLLKSVIEHEGLHDFSRFAALKAYSFLARDKVISKTELIDYLRSLMHKSLSSEEESSFIFAEFADIALNEHLFELIPEVRNLYKRGLIDTFFLGDYDDFINQIFHFYPNRDKEYIDDTIAELGDWACYRQAPEPIPEPVEKKQKIGRNDPCPCGSGKKYKKCCLNKPIDPAEFLKEIEESAYIEDRDAENRLAKGIFGDAEEDELFDTEPYNLMTDYPEVKDPTKKGEKLFVNYFNPQGIEIDIPVYKALHRRRIPLLQERDNQREDLERIDFLLEAFEGFTALCCREEISSFDRFDEKYMVHFDSLYWVEELGRMLTAYRDQLPPEKYHVLDAVSETLERMKAADLVIST